MNQQKSILIIDDDVGMLKTLDYVLTAKGFDVTTTNNGPEAIALIKERSFTFILSDIRMPGMNGVETLKEIKRISPGTNVMMITAYTMHELVQEAKKEGAEAVFSKPLELDKVISHLETHDMGDTEDTADKEQPSALIHILENREKELKEKNLLIEMLKQELEEIKENPAALFEQERRKRQGERLPEILNPKQYGLYEILSSGEKNYEELLQIAREQDLDIRDLEALRLQLSRLDNKLQKETNLRVEKFRKQKVLYFKIKVL